jgi:hypothetical protein
MKKNKILFGLLLGNASLQTYTGGKTWRIRFSQSNVDYLFHLYCIFVDYVKTPPKEFISDYGHRRWTFNTTVTPLGLKFSKMFYKKNKKKMPSKKDLVLYLSPIGLAYWFMDNGSLKSNCLSYYLCTDCFNLDELKVIREVFKEKYDIDISFHKQRSNYRIYIPKRESKKFYNLIEKYVYISMKYKLGNH